MNKSVLCLLLVLMPLSAVSAGKYYDFSPTAQEAYQQLFSLRFDAARQTLSKLKQQEPDNLIHIFLENYLEVLRIGLDDDEVAYKRLSGNMDKRLYQLSRGEPRSPYYRYTQAETRLQWAVLEARFGDYLSCLSDVKQAYALLEENDRRFPDFVANKKSLGILHALVGNVPDDYRWAVQLIGGMQGTIEQGLGELAGVLQYAQNQPFLFESETLIAYSVLQLNLNNQAEKAWNVLNSERLNPKTNALEACAMAAIGLRSGHTDEAIRVLLAAPGGPDYHPVYQRDLLLGMAKLYRLDADADQWLERFITNFPGKNGLKEAWQKRAWYQLLQGNTAGYYSAMWNVKQLGAARSEPDKVALREANSAEIPDVLLLKGRLLFDGGFFGRAFDLLKNKGADYAAHWRNNLEYHYRMGRILHKTGKLDEAIRFYETTLNSGENAPWYFACNAALQLGVICEAKQDARQARTWYQKCLAIHPEEYAGSLHAKAKAGLNRLH